MRSQVQPFGIEAGYPPLSVRRARELRGIQADRIRMVGIHMGDGVFFRSEKVGAFPAIDQKILRRDIDDTAESGNEMDRFRFNRVKGKVREAGIKTRVRVFRQETPPDGRKIRRKIQITGFPDNSGHRHTNAGERIMTVIFLHQQGNAPVGLYVSRMNREIGQKQYRRAARIGRYRDQRREGRARVRRKRQWKLAIKGGVLTASASSVVQEE